MNDESLWAVVIYFLHWAQFYCFDLIKPVKQLPQNLWLHGCTVTGKNIIYKQIQQVICYKILFNNAFDCC